MRHGKAERHSDSGRDEDRPLSDRGRAQAEGIARLFTAPTPPRELSARPAAVLCSPAARADGTARIVARFLGLVVNHEEALALDSTLREHVALVARLLDRGQPTLLVGHNPLLSRLVDHLAGGDELRTGELSSMEIQETSGAAEVGRCRVDS